MHMRVPVFRHGGDGKCVFWPQGLSLSPESCCCQCLRGKKGTQKEFQTDPGCYLLHFSCFAELVIEI